MRIIFTILIYILCSSAIAQNFEVLNREGEIYTGNIGSVISAKLSIKNLTAHTIQVAVKRIERHIEASHTTYCCLEDDCFGMDGEETSVRITIGAGGVSNQFASILEAGGVAGQSAVTYRIYEPSNPKEAVFYQFDYLVGEALEGGKPIYSSETITLNDFYPNPVKDVAVIDYSLKTASEQAKVIVHNILGSIMGEYLLEPTAVKVKVQTGHLSPGVYFYTLYIDNSGKATRKFIVER